MSAAHNLQESSSTCKIETTIKIFYSESLRRKRIEGAAQVPFLANLPEIEWGVYRRVNENRTGSGMDRVAFMEEFWSVVQCYGTQSMLKTILNRPLMQEIYYKLDECEGRMSELLNDSAIDEREA